jgi:hypothetical protein
MKWEKKAKKLIEASELELKNGNVINGFCNPH